MYQLIYVSRATSAVDRAEWMNLVDEAATLNQRRGITGALLCLDGRFVQVLEGEAPVVHGLFASIAQDPRHADVTIVSQRQVAHRQFSGWAMCGHFVDLAEPRDAARFAQVSALLPDLLHYPGSVMREDEQLLYEVLGDLRGERLAA